MDLVVTVPRFPKSGETLFGDAIHYIPGGKGGNQAVAAARLGARTAMIGAVGNDAFGQALTKSLERNGVDVEHVKVAPAVPTGTASITLAPEDNTIVVVPGANATVSAEDVDRIDRVIAESDIVLLQLEIPMDAVERAAAAAKQHEKPVILNPAPARKLSDELLRSVDYITPNRSELEIMTGMDLSRHSLEEAMDRLLELGPRCVVTTLGAEGAAWKLQGGPLVRQAAYRVPVTDTTGAGDAFNAGLAYYLAAGHELEQAVRSAMKVSALAVTKFGAQDGMPTREEVEQFNALPAH